MGVLNARGVKAAYDSGMDRTYLGSAKRAERNVLIDNVARIALALKVEAGRLLKDEP